MGAPRSPSQTEIRESREKSEKELTEAGKLLTDNVFEAKQLRMENPARPPAAMRYDEKKAQLHEQVTGFVRDLKASFAELEVKEVKGGVSVPVVLDEKTLDVLDQKARSFFDNLTSGTDFEKIRAQWDQDLKAVRTEWGHEFKRVENTYSNWSQDIKARATAARGDAKIMEGLQREQKQLEQSFQNFKQFEQKQLNDLENFKTAYLKAVIDQMNQFYARSLTSARSVNARTRARAEFNRHWRRVDLSGQGPTQEGALLSFAGAELFKAGLYQRGNDQIQIDDKGNVFAVPPPLTQKDFKKTYGNIIDILRVDMGAKEIVINYGSEKNVRFDEVADLVAIMKAKDPKDQLPIVLSETTIRGLSAGRDRQSIFGFTVQLNNKVENLLAEVQDYNANLARSSDGFKSGVRIARLGGVVDDLDKLHVGQEVAGAHRLLQSPAVTAAGRARIEELKTNIMGLNIDIEKYSDDKKELSVSDHELKDFVARYREYDHKASSAELKAQLAIITPLENKESAGTALIAAEKNALQDARKQFSSIVLRTNLGPPPVRTRADILNDIKAFRDARQGELKVFTDNFKVGLIRDRKLDAAPDNQQRFQQMHREVQRDLARFEKVAAAKQEVDEIIKILHNDIKNNPENKYIGDQQRQLDRAYKAYHQEMYDVETRLDAWKNDMKGHPVDAKVDANLEREQKQTITQLDSALAKLTEFREREAKEDTRATIESIPGVQAAEAKRSQTERLRLAQPNLEEPEAKPHRPGMG